MKYIVYFIAVSIVLSCASKEKKIETKSYKLTRTIDSIMSANFMPANPGATIIVTKKAKNCMQKVLGSPTLN